MVILLKAKGGSLVLVFARYTVKGALRSAVLPECRWPHVAMSASRRLGVSACWCGVNKLLFFNRGFFFMQYDPDIFRLIYVSRNQIKGGQEAQEAEIADILLTARARNHQLDVTGALLFSNGYFAQVLEGPQDQVEDLYARISRDSRHSDVMVLVAEATDRRHFAEWSMDYGGSDCDVADRFARCFESHQSQTEKSHNIFFTILKGHLKDLERNSLKLNGL